MNIVYGILSKVLNMSLTASLAIVAVLALRFLLRKAPKQFSYLLWGVVLFRLLCPVSINSGISLLGLAGVTANGSGEMEYAFFQEAVLTGRPAGDSPYLEDAPFTPSSAQEKPHTEAGEGTGGVQSSSLSVPSPMDENGTGGQGAAGTGALPGGLSPDWLPLLSSIWLSGIGVLGIYSMWSALRLRRQVSCSMPLGDRLYLADGIPSPFVLGLFRPKIYLPSSIQESEREYIILHEQYHIRRRDYLMKPLAFFALCLHWFNPLVWLAFLLAMKDMEMSCDEAVMRGMDGDIRAEYADSLLHLTLGKRRVTGSPLAFGEGNAEKRIKNVMNYKKPAAAIGIVAAVACLAGAACLATNPVSVPQTMEWAQNLSLEEVESIELVVMPQEAEKQYRRFSPGEFEGILSLIRQGRGKYLQSHEEMEGGSISFYLTMKDGTEHQVGNLGNTYLYIDGDYYDAGYEWLSSWAQDYGEGNARLPQGFLGEAGDDAMAKFQAKIIEMEEGGMQVEPVEGSQELASADRIRIPFGEAGFPSGLKAGDTVEITYNGEIMESYPAQLGEVYQITKIEGQESSSLDRTPQVSQEAYAAIWEAIMEHNGGVYEGTEEYDVACCSFVNLGEEPDPSAAGSTGTRVTYYGWAYYAEYKFSETGIEETSGSYTPVALSFTLDPDGGHTLEEYWVPSEGSGFVPDIREKFPPSIAEDGLDSQKFVDGQIRECYAQAIASAELDTEPMVGHLLDTICGSGSRNNLSSNPQDYIDAHSIEYRKLGYFGEDTLKYCLKRFHQGGQTGLKGHIMARACEALLGDRWEFPLKASEAAIGQEWYDALKAEVGNWGERAIEPEDELPLSILKIGIPIQIMGNVSWISDRKAIPSGEGHLAIQFYNDILGGQCTFLATKGGELELPNIEYDPSKEETWGGADAHGGFVEVKAQHAEAQMLVSWEYKDYRFALTADVPEGMDTNVVPKMALDIIRQLK